MTLEYELTKEDYLEYQLYISSKSTSHLKKRNRARFLFPIVYFILGIVTAFANKSVVSVFIWVLLAFLWIILYPFYSSWKYKNHFKNHINENYTNRINKLSKLEFTAKHLKTSDKSSKGKIKYSELKSLIELPNHYFIKLAIDMSIIVPKDSIKDNNEFRLKMDEIGIEYINETNWKWS